MLENYIEQLKSGRSLDAAQVRATVDLLTDESVSSQLKAEFLTALARKNETVEEITAFARALGEKAIRPPIDAQLRSRELLDVVGTGGDRLGTFNISTSSAIICAAAGITVVKHGNRAITSQTGSADVLQALGVKIDLSPAEAVESLHRHNFAFLFAPNYYPAFRNIGAARKLCAEKGQRTIFNLLGPLLNPARPSAMLVGVPRPEFCEPLAKVLQSLGVRRAMVICGKVASSGFLDELSTLGENMVAEFYQERGFAVSTLLPEQFPLQKATLTDLQGGDKAENARIVRDVLSGKERGAKRDAVLLNTSAALFVAGKAKSLADGWDLASEVIDQGKAGAKLTELTQG